MLYDRRDSYREECSSSFRLEACLFWLKKQEPNIYGGCARSTSGSQNLAVPRKRHDNSLFLQSQPKKKAVLKLPWPLLIVKLRIAAFTQNNTTITLPGDNPRTTSELSYRKPVIHF